MPKQDLSTEELQNSIRNLEQKVAALESNRGNSSSEALDRNLADQSKGIASDAVALHLGEILWSKVFYIASFATSSTDTTTTEVLPAGGRESDTTAGKQFRPERPSKFRTAFYLGTNISKLTAYIASPGLLFTTSTIPSSILDSKISFVGIKIDSDGDVSLITSLRGVTTTKATGVTITDDTTNILEINYFVKYADVYLNNVSLGSIPCDILSSTQFEVFFPFISSVGSSDGTSVNLTLDSYEFMQLRS